MSKTAVTILIIDDTPEDRETYKELLLQNREYIYTFFEAEDGESALDICNNVELDCILLDYLLPVMDGMHFLTMLRAQSETVRQIPVIVITGRGSEGVAVATLKLGALDYLIKSEVTAEGLYRATKNAFERLELTKALQVQAQRRARTEDELRAGEERFRLLIESIQDYALIMLDEQGKVASWNSGARQILGYHDTEILGQHFRKFFAWEDLRAQVPETCLKRAMHDGVSKEERFMVRKSGDLFCANATVRPIRDAMGDLRGFVQVIKDITELKRAQEASDVSQDRLEAALQATPIPLMMIECASGRLLFSNSAVCELFGDAFDPEADHIERCFVSEKGIPTRVAVVDRAASGETLASEEVLCPLGNKNFRLVVSTVPLRAVRDHGETILIFLQDVTHLRQGIDDLREAVEARDEFLSIASHELKTPLTSLKLQSEILLRVLGREQQEVVREQTQTMTRILSGQIDRLNHVISDMLEVSRMNAGRFELRLVDDDLRRILDQAIARFRIQLQNAGCDLTLEAEANVAGQWDPGRMMQVIENLLSNAVKYAPGKPIKVQLWTDADKAKLSIRDHGEGISEDLQDVIFERFARAIGSNKISGLGLGLYIVRRIVMAHGGSINVQSAPGQGAIFTVTLPRNQETTSPTPSLRRGSSEHEPTRLDC